MDRRIKQIADELNVTIEFHPNLDRHGHYIAAINLVVIKEGLPELEEMRALLHELGHACKHHNNYVLYQQTFSLRSKMEAEAEGFMLEKLFDRYISIDGIDVTHMNYMKFLEDNNLNPNYEPQVKRLISKYLKDPSFA